MEELPPQLFTMLMKRFDTIEKQNDDQLKLLSAHIKEDDRAHEIVERHSTYFAIMSLGIAPLSAYLGHKLGWPKL
jgi:hypothetical protein